MNGATGNGIAIDVKGLTKSFGGREVVHDLSMQVKRGSIYGFLGPNGSGKTTTIRMLCGLLTPDKGRGTCLGFDILTEAERIKTHVGYMTQRFSLYDDLSVRENLEFIARIYGIEKPAAAAHAAIERLGLTGRDEQLAGELSGGWKQRLALAARHQLAVGDVRDLVTALGLVHVVGGDEYGEPFGGERVDLVPELAPRFWIDAGRRLVEQQELRARQRAGAEREPLLPAAG